MFIEPVVSPLLTNSTKETLSFRCGRKQTCPTRISIGAETETRANGTERHSASPANPIRSFFFRKAVSIHTRFQQNIRLIRQPVIHRSFRLFFILKQPEPRSDLSYPIRKTGLQTFMTLCCFKTTQCQTQSTTLLQETPINRFGRIFHWHGQHPVSQSINRLSFGMRGNPFWPQILRKAYFAPMIPPHTLATRESATPINTIQAAAVTALTSC